MGLSAAFLGGFVDAANRSVYENRMAKHEQSIQDRANFREDKKEAKARADKVTDNIKATQDAIDAADARATAQGELNSQQAGFRADAVELANKQDFDTKLAYVMEQYPGLPEDLAKTFADGDISFITDMKRAQNTYIPDLRRFSTLEERNEVRAHTIAGTMRPRNLAEGIRYEDTDWYNKVVQSIIQGRPIDELAEDGWSQELVLNDAKQVIDVRAVFTDPNMYTPDQNEYDNLSSAANTVLSVINTMTPDDLILDSEGDILQGDMRIAFHNLEQLASDLYVKQNGRTRENVVIDRIFTRERLELLAELTDTRMELPNELIMLASDPDGLAAIQTMEDEDKLLDAYDNLIARKKLHQQGILPADEVAIDAALMAISTNPAFMQFTEAKKAEAAAVGVPEPEDIPRNQLPEDVQGIITVPGKETTRTSGRGVHYSESPTTYELDDVGIGMMALAVQAQQEAPLTSGRNPMPQNLLKFVLEQFNLDNTIFGRGVAQYLIKSYRN